MGAHAGLLAALRGGAPKPAAKVVTIELAETVRPRPPPAPAPEPPPPPESPALRRTGRRLARAAIPRPASGPSASPSADNVVPTEGPPTPVRLGLSLGSTHVGGAWAAPVGDPRRGVEGGAPEASGPVGKTFVPLSSLTVLPEALETEVPRSEYPPEALRAGLEARVVLELSIDATGRVEAARIMKEEGEGFGAAAVRIARRYFRFRPARRDGAAVATRITFTVHFELP
jgi:periplasmic protein TonB